MSCRHMFVVSQSWKNSQYHKAERKIQHMKATLWTIKPNSKTQGGGEGPTAKIYT